MQIPATVTSHRLRIFARKLLYGSANEGDISEIACLLVWMADEVEQIETNHTGP